MPEPTSFTFNFTKTQIDALRKVLESRSFAFREVPYAHFGAQKDKLTVNAYTSGKVLVQGKAAKEFVEFVIEPEISGEAKVGYEEVHQPEMFEPHFGVDESGKGDFFGPLVVAGAYVDRLLARRLLELGARDSKQIKSDKKAEDMAEAIRELLAGRHVIVAMGPERYNELYRKFGNLNRLLAWGHARVIESLLELVPACPRALSDQFAHPSLIERALQKKGREIVLQQRTKAEADVAVAAASILARAEFVRRLRLLGESAGVLLPKGASAQVKDAAREVVAKHGEDGLRRVAKAHFKTYFEVLGKPLPGQAEVLF